MRRSQLVLAAVLAGLSLPACFIVVEHGSSTTRSRGSSWSSGPEHVGSGVAAHETRALSAFTQVEGGDTLTFDVRVGTPASVTVHGDDNLLVFVHTDVEDGRLAVSMESGSYDVRNELRVELVMPGLESCTMGGAGETRIQGLDGRDLRLEVNGTRRLTASGHVATLAAEVTGAAVLAADDLRARELALNVSGTARATVVAERMGKVSSTGASGVHVRGLDGGQTHVTLAGTSDMTLDGRVEAIEAHLTGATHLRGNLQVQRARMHLSGTSQAQVNATEELEAEVSGASQLTYGGSPERLRTRATGAGSVKASP